ncbi:hypothetical protein IP92_05347 [Pseudoduganella flava]|uniref:DUF2219 family protein n=1 Tax=Pseudoduganella flava TaxID=871742 RepID=A0A562PF09_9BURK|nr:hypothetical protein [Pseudoduganella flava]QGZ38929.1 hypothetical protein GO485_07645 [Pseudoduganella flava]TWI43011.1 hypothetical protein IP92_05347 [Pseudoduganella flava]
MRRIAIAAALAAALPCAAGAALDGVARAQVETWHSALPGLDGARPAQAVDLRGQAGIAAETIARGTVGLRHEAGGTRLRVFELALERPLAGGYATVGKKVMSWDVGYAFRPLDVVQQEDRRALYPGTLEGVPMLAWEAADAERAVTVVWSNPGRGLADQPRDDEALAVRLYRQRGARDEYAVLRVSRRSGIEAGASLSQVLDEGTEVHASLLAQARHATWDGMRWREAGGGGKALAGFTWTTESRFSLLGEAWLDRTAPAAQQGNVLLRAAQKIDDVEIAADVLRRAAGTVFTVAGSWKNGAWLVSASWRRYGQIVPGHAASVGLVTLERAF